MSQVLTLEDVIAIPEDSVAGFAGISFNGTRFQIKVLGTSKGTDAVRQRFACPHLRPLPCGQAKRCLHLLLTSSFWRAFLLSCHVAASQTREGAGLRWARSIFEEKPNIYLKRAQKVGLLMEYVVAEDERPAAAAAASRKKSRQPRAGSSSRPWQDDSSDDDDDDDEEEEPPSFVSNFAGWHT